MRTTTHRAFTALVAAATFGLAGCADADRADFEPQQSSSEQSQGQSQGQEDTDAAPTTDGPAEAAAGGTEAGPTGPVEPAEPRTVEVGETYEYSEDGTAYTVTVHRVVVNDYYVEAEVTIVNDGNKRFLTLYTSSSMPALYDDRGREYAYQQHAGSGEQLFLESGEGLDAVLVFAGRLDPQARTVTLDLGRMGGSEDPFQQAIFEIQVGGAR